MTLFPQSFVSFLHRALCFDNRLHLDSRQVYNRIIFPLSTHLSLWVAIFAGLTRMGLLALGLVWPPWIPAMSRLWVLCWSPSTAMAPGHRHQPRESKMPANIHWPGEWIKWVSLNHYIVHPVFIASIPLITCPCPRHDRSITELSIAIITDQIRKISNQSFYFPSDRMCQACETDGWYRGTVHFVMYC